MSIRDFVLCVCVFALAACSSAPEAPRDNVTPVSQPTVSDEREPHATSPCDNAMGAPFRDLVEVCEDLDLDGGMNDGQCGNVPRDAIPSNCLVRYKDGAIGDAARDKLDGTYTDVTAYYAHDVDCDDGNPLVYKGAAELPDWVDNDCDGEADEAEPYRLDEDGDGYAVAPDKAIGWRADITCTGHAPRDDLGCPSRGPKMGHVWIRVPEGTPDDCDDEGNGAELYYPGAVETRPQDGDRNCDGAISCYVDEDGDAHGDSAVIEQPDGGPPKAKLVPSGDPDCADPGESWDNQDCDDGEPTAYMGAPEVIDGIDNNCKDGTDEKWCETSFTVEPVTLSSWLSIWHANVVVGLQDRELNDVGGMIRVGLGNDPMKETCGYSPAIWDWDSSHQDIAIGGSTGPQFVTIRTEGDYLAHLVINGVVWSRSGSTTTPFRRLVLATDTPDSLPFRITGRLITCSDDDHVLDVIPSFAVTDGDLYVDLRPSN